MGPAAPSSNSLITASAVMMYPISPEKECCRQSIQVSCCWIAKRGCQRGVLQTHYKRSGLSSGPSVLRRKRAYSTSLCGIKDAYAARECAHPNPEPCTSRYDTDRQSRQQRCNVQAVQPQCKQTGEDCAASVQVAAGCADDAAWRRLCRERDGLREQGAPL